jgi:hypothetical protein
MLYANNQAEICLFKDIFQGLLIMNVAGYEGLFMRTLLTGLFLLLLACNSSASEVQRRTANDGQLVMEDIPPIPVSLPQTLSRYQNIR